jgi:hypothetical protein
MLADQRTPGRVHRADHGPGFAAAHSVLFGALLLFLLHARLRS